jgi:hypothetical protein
MHASKWIHRARSRESFEQYAIGGSSEHLDPAPRLGSAPSDPKNAIVYRNSHGGAHFDSELRALFQVDEKRGHDERSRRIVGHVKCCLTAEVLHDSTLLCVLEVYFRLGPERQYGAIR